MRQVYSVKVGHGEIRRVNINAAPWTTPATRRSRRPASAPTRSSRRPITTKPTAASIPADTRKGDYLWRLDGVARAMEAGCDDVGIGALFGLYDWRFEVLGAGRPRPAPAEALQRRAAHHQLPAAAAGQRRAAGRHATWSATTQFKRLVAILRLAVPYTGLILTAREPPELRREVLAFGVSQIDAGSRIELGGYTEAGDAQVMEREQFELGDIRPLDDGDARAGGRRLHPQFLHRLLPAGPHRRALHGVRHPRLHPELLHAQRPDHADGVPAWTTPRRRPTRPGSG